VAKEMRYRLDGELASCDHLAAWTLMYLQVTESLSQQLAGANSFDDPTWVGRLSAVFADLWFQADEAWKAGKSDAMTPAWRAVYEAASAKQVNATGNALMAINAHISGDLPVALQIVSDPTRDHHGDYVAVNQLFELALAPGLAAIAQRLEPSASLIFVPNIGEEQAVVAAVAAWREEAWVNSSRLLAGGNRRTVLTSIQTVAAGRAATLQLATTYPPLLGGAATRDAYCRQHR
jgi:hypothetical protein